MMSFDPKFFKAAVTTVAQKCHGNFNLLTAISILLTTISILLTAISIYSRQFRDFTPGTFNFFTATLTAFFASLTTCQLQPPTVALHQSQNAKSKVDI